MTNYKVIIRLWVEDAKDETDVVYKLVSSKTISETAAQEITDIIPEEEDE